MADGGMILNAVTLALVVLCAGAIAITLFLMFSAGPFVRKTCSRCGGQLPVTRMQIAIEPGADWICETCGTRFDCHGKARGQLS